MLLAVAVACLAAAGAAGAADALILHLKNGDRLTGTVISRDAGQVVLTNATLGRLVLPVAAIEREEKPPADKASAPPAAAPAPAKVVAKVATPPPPPPSFWKRYVSTNLHGSLQMGADLGYGTTHTEMYHGQAQLVHTIGRVRDTADFSAAYGKTDGVLAANRMEGSLKTDVDLGSGKKLYVYNLGSAGFDEVNKLELRYQEGAGMGYKVFDRGHVFGKADAMVINLEGGAQYQEFHYIRTVPPKKTEVSIRFGQNMTWRIPPKITLTEKFSFAPNVSNFADYRTHVELNAAYPLLDKWTLNLTMSDDYEAEPPLGVRPNDLQIRSSLGFKF